MGKTLRIATGRFALPRLLAERVVALSGVDRLILTQFVQEQTALLLERGAEQTPILFARLYDLAGCFRDLLRVEDAYELKPDAVGFETLGKARDRFRKAMRDYEDSLRRLGASGGNGLADSVRPLLERAKGALESVLTATEGEQEPTDPSAPERSPSV